MITACSSKDAHPFDIAELRAPEWRETVAQPCHQISQHVIVAAQQDRLMEFPIRGVVAIHVILLHRLAAVGMTLHHARAVFLGHAQRRMAGAGRLQLANGLKHLVDGVGVHLDDDGSAIGPRLDQPGAGKLAQGLAHRRARDLEPGRQTHFVEFARPAEERP